MKTICIYHSRDLDGWMSAAIVKKWFKKVNDLKPGYSIYDLPDGNRVDQYFRGDNCNIANNKLFLFGWDYGNDIPDLSEYDKVIMCDVSFPRQSMHSLTCGDFVWIDHHISAINAVSELCDPNGLRSTEFAACELTWKYFFPDEEMPNVVNMLGLYDSYRHVGTEKEEAVLCFQYGARRCISDYKDAYDFLNESNDEHIELIKSMGRSIYHYLKEEAKQIINSAFEIMFFVDSNGEKTIGEECLIFLCVNQPNFNYKNFGIELPKNISGVVSFHYENGKWKFSLRSDKVDCSEIAKYYGGGGHKGAAGFMVEDVNSIIENHKK